jgi:hypothetical protein
MSGQGITEEDGDEEKQRNSESIRCGQGKSLKVLCNIRHDAAATEEGTWNCRPTVKTGKKGLLLGQMIQCLA